MLHLLPVETVIWIWQICGKPEGFLVIQLDKHVGVHFIGICVYDWGEKKIKRAQEALKQMKGHPQVNYL